MKRSNLQSFNLLFLVVSAIFMIIGRLNNDLIMVLGGIWFMLVPSVYSFFEVKTEK